MKRSVLSVLLVILTTLTYGQNWNCFVPGMKQYFTNSYGYLRGMRIDSVRTVGSETVYYPFHTVRGFSSTHHIIHSFDSASGSWLGKKVIRDSAGNFLFDNEWGDTVIIKTQANTRDSWVFYSDSSNLFYKATVISKDTISILGLVDSIKRIDIQAYVGSVAVVDSINGIQIILSKNNGFATVFDLYTFPYHMANTIYSDTLDYFLSHSFSYPSYYPNTSNQSFQRTQLINPTWATLNDWNVGDVFEIKGYPYNYPNELVNYHNYYTDTIITKTVTATSVNYHFSGWKAIYTFPGGGPPYYVNSGNSGDLSYPATNFIDTNLMPEEKSNPRICFYFPNDTSYSLLSPKYHFKTIYYGWVPGLTYPYLPNMDYKIGLGIVNYHGDYSSGMPAVSVDTNLLYYKRGSIEWGKYYPAEVPILTHISGMEIYPNPANEEVTIKAGINASAFQADVLNILGQVVLSAISEEGKCEFSVKNLPNGIYTVRVRAEEAYYNEKLLVTH